VHLARGTSAATTVSATAVLAAGAGIRVFATGGIGGVHRGDGSDVSHDLYALARTPIAVISAGAKAILDLPRTLELLETLGVLVIGWHRRAAGVLHARERPDARAPRRRRSRARRDLPVRWDGLGKAACWSPTRSRPPPPSTSRRSTR
jgi:pseudouridine-5'-phosphate glycosidase